MYGMIFDGHMHLVTEEENDTGKFAEWIKMNGVRGGILISLPPVSFGALSRSAAPHSNHQRLEHLFRWTGTNPDMYPFYWLNPLEEDAEEQVDIAVKKGVRGFKVICSSFYPGDVRALKIFRKIAQVPRPILFHSGILFDGTDSARYNRPYEFEALLEVPGLKFSLAHVSWPWCDECIAVYGKFKAAYSRFPERKGEIFVDITPGTPAVFREAVLNKLFRTGYNDIMNDVIFGTDCKANRYDYKYAHGIICGDKYIFQRLGIDRNNADKIFVHNLERFVQ